MNAPNTALSTHSEYSTNNDRPSDDSTSEGIVVRIAIPAEDFILDETFRTLPRAEFRLGRAVAVPDSHSFPLLWGRHAELPTLTEMLRDDASVKALTVLGEGDDEWSYQIEWAYGSQLLVQALLHQGGMLTSATARDGRWTLRLVLPNRDALSAVHEVCESHNVTIDVQRISTMRTNPSQTSRLSVSLTDTQYETLVTAYKAGYFQVPREKNMEDLSPQLGVTHQALSERLRRASRTLIEETLDLDKSGDL